MPVDRAGAPLLRREPEGHPAARAAVRLAADVELELHLPRRHRDRLVAPHPADFVGRSRRERDVVVGEGRLAAVLPSGDHAVVVLVERVAEAQLRHDHVGGQRRQLLDRRRRGGLGRSIELHLGRDRRRCRGGVLLRTGAGEGQQAEPEHASSAAEHVASASAWPSAWRSCCKRPKVVWSPPAVTSGPPPASTRVHADFPSFVLPPSFHTLFP